MPKKIVILGAGISGLSAGWFLKTRFKGDIELTLLEKDSRAGGWIQTINKEEFLFELGPHSCRMNQAFPQFEELLDDLELNNQIILPASSSRKRYLYIDRKLNLIPSNPLGLLFSPFGMIVLKGLWKDLWEKQGKSSDESIHAFFTRRLGSSIADRFVDSLVNGIYAGDPKQLSIRSCFPAIYELEQRHGGLLRGLIARKNSKKGGFFSFKGGMEVLPQALARRLESHLRLSTAAKRLIAHSDGVEIELENGTKLAADHVISTLPSYALNTLLKKEMIEIPFNTVHVVCLGYSTSVLEKQGFGYLIPSMEKEEILGVIWDSSVFPQQNRHEQQTRLTVMIGDQTGESKDYIKMALNSLSKHLNINRQPDVVHYKSAKSAIPQYTLGHSERLKGIERELKDAYPHLTVLGNSFYGVSVPECIERAYAISIN